MYYTIKLSEHDKNGLNRLLSKRVQSLGEKLAHGEIYERVGLDIVGDELKIVSNIRFAIENAEEIPHGKE